VTLPPGVGGERALLVATAATITFAYRNINEPAFHFVKAVLLGGVQLSETVRMHVHHG